MLGRGVVGTGAVELAAAFGNEAAVFWMSIRTPWLPRRPPLPTSPIRTNCSNLEKCLRSPMSSSTHNPVAKDRKDYIVYREDLEADEARKRRS